MTENHATAFVNELLTTPTAAERLAKVQAWLSLAPTHADLLTVYKGLIEKDKGASKAVREHLDKHKEQKHQEEQTQHWQAQAEALLAEERLAIASILAWQRDALKAQAPLSKEPLLSLKAALQNRLAQIEDTENQVQIQKESAILLAQRIDTLSTKSWEQAQAQADSLKHDVAQWQQKTQSIETAKEIASVEQRYTEALASASKHLNLVWQAFVAALEMGQQAVQDASLPLPGVGSWAADIRSLQQSANPSKASSDGKSAPPQAQNEERQAQREQALALITPVLTILETELQEGHGKASAEASHKLRELLKKHDSYLDTATHHRAHTALAAAGELIDWQRWRSDQIRTQLITQAQALCLSPQPPRKQQEALRQLREAWKQTDQGGVPNHALWKAFDQHCNEAHKTVETWLSENKAQEQAQIQLREQLIADVRAFAQSQATDTTPNWKQQQRALLDFEKRWREGGHVSEKTYGVLHPKWKQALTDAFGPLREAQRLSTEKRKALVQEATLLAAQRPLPLKAIKQLQEQWRTEAQALLLERRLEQKLWDAFRKPLDAAFAEKENSKKADSAAQSALEQAIEAGIAALDAANASGDAQAIHAALANLDAIAQGRPAASPTTAQTPATNAAVAPETAPAEIQTEIQAETPAATEATPPETPAAAENAVENAAENAASAEAASTETPPAETLATPTETDAAADEGASEQNASEPSDAPSPTAPTAQPTVVKRVIAMRGDDRPGAKLGKEVQAKDAGRADPRKRDGARDNKRDSAGRDGPRSDPRNARDGERRDARGARDERGSRPDRRDERRDDRHDDRHGERHQGLYLPGKIQATLRDARERAAKALKNLHSQAHGKSLQALLDAWQNRDVQTLPALTELSKRLKPAEYQLWQKTLAAPQNNTGANKTASGPSPEEALLQLEIAAELPSPAAHQTARRQMQLQLLTQRKHQDPDAGAWKNLVAQIFASPYSDENAQRLLAVLKKQL